MTNYDAWIIDESRLGEGFHVQVIDRTDDDQATHLVGYGFPSEQDAERYLARIQTQHDIRVLSREVI